MVKFDIEKTVTYWKEGSEYDLEVAKACFKAESIPMRSFSAIWPWKNS